VPVVVAVVAAVAAGVVGVAGFVAGVQGPPLVVLAGQWVVGFVVVPVVVGVAAQAEVFLLIGVVAL
jgi:hypothetical protein